eukprot:COSAG01_NODE_53441_length_339_cov_0.791667_1_plen_48_part_01
MPQGEGRTVDSERGGGGGRQAIRGWRCALRQSPCPVRVVTVIQRLDQR